MNAYDYTSNFSVNRNDNDLEEGTHMKNDKNSINERYFADILNPLQYACGKGDIDAVNRILREGGNPNLQEEALVVPNFPPIHIAARYGYTDIIEVLLQHGATICKDNYGYSPLHYAVLHGHRDTVSYLIQHGNSMEELTKDGTSAMDIAENLQLHDVAESLRLEEYRGRVDDQTRFRKWLTEIDCGEYFHHFLSAGYDFEFVCKHGLNDEDLDCVGIPSAKLGHRRKLKALYLIDLHKPTTTDREASEEDRASNDASDEEENEEEEEESEEDETEDDSS